MRGVNVSVDRSPNEISEKFFLWEIISSTLGSRTYEMFCALADPVNPKPSGEALEMIAEVLRLLVESLSLAIVEGLRWGGKPPAHLGDLMRLKLRVRLFGSHRSFWTRTFNAKFFMKTITPAELNRRLQAGEKLHLLDVRTPAEHAEIHVPGVHLVPLDRLDPAELVGVKGFAKDQPVLVFCRSGGRAKMAAEQLEKSGFEDCEVVEGGTMAWAEAGLPVNRGTSGVMSLERQVRIAAGAIVLAGALLAQFVSPGFLWVSGFVGAGLIFAGLTDTCAMGMLIAKLPWNQRGSG